MTEKITIFISVLNLKIDNVINKKNKKYSLIKITEWFDLEMYDKITIAVAHIPCIMVSQSQSLLFKLGD